MSSLRLDFCSHDAAKYAVMHWHYSRTMPVGKLVRVGVWEHGKFIGCVLFGSGSPGVHQLGIALGATNRCAELVRVALTSHDAPVSRIVAIAIRVLRKQSPNLGALVSYADPAQGHVGSIYQAGGWTYTGTSGALTVYTDNRGKVYHSRTVSTSGMKTHYGTTSKCARGADMTTSKMPPKHRYIMAFEPAVSEKVKAMSMPYPKKRSSVSRLESEATGTTGEGRCDATDTLQSSEEAANGPTAR